MKKIIISLFLALAAKNCMAMKMGETSKSSIANDIVSCGDYTSNLVVQFLDPVNFDECGNFKPTSKLPYEIQTEIVKNVLTNSILAWLSKSVENRCKDSKSYSLNICKEKHGYYLKKSGQSVDIIDAETGDCLHTLSHGSQVFSAQFNKEGTCVVTTSCNNTAKIWDVTFIHDIKNTLKHVTIEQAFLMYLLYEIALLNRLCTSRNRHSQKLLFDIKFWHLRPIYDRFTLEIKGAINNMGILDKRLQYGCQVL